MKETLVWAVVALALGATAALRAADPLPPPPAEGRLFETPTLEQPDSAPAAQGESEQPEECDEAKKK